MKVLQDIRMASNIYNYYGHPIYIDTSVADTSFLACPYNNLLLFAAEESKEQA